MLDGYKHSWVSVTLMLLEPYPSSIDVYSVLYMDSSCCISDDIID